MKNNFRDKTVQILELVYTEGFTAGNLDGQVSTKNTRGKYLDELRDLFQSHCRERIDGIMEAIDTELERLGGDK